MYKFLGGIVLLGVSVAAPAIEPFQPLPTQPPIPSDNPQTPEKIELGKQLFFDQRLSITGTHACVTCHNLSAGGEDGRAVSIGVYGRAGGRNTQTVWNAAYHTAHNWDGGANTLEQQAKEHLLDPRMMAMPDGETVVARLNTIPGYRAQFENVFGRNGLSYDNVAKALASFERTLVTPNSAFDRYLRGDKSAISESAQRGFREFIEVRCASCHFWVNLAGPIPGLAFKQGEGFYELFPNYPGTEYERRYNLAQDLGRYHLTLDPADQRLWRMPSLRNVAVTAPYFHNGAVKTLDEAVRVMAKTQLKRDLTDAQVSDIVVFLNTLTGEFPEMRLPRLPQTVNHSALAGHDD